MGYSISFKTAVKKSSIKHNNRDFNEEDWNTKYHRHIHQNQTSKNQYLIQEDIHKVYDELFGKSVEEYNQKQKRKDRKIEDYFNHVKKSKTLDIQREFIIQIGDINNYQYDLMDHNKEIANQILKEYVKDFEERNPNLKIYNAVIHNDEATPHLHMNVIPVAEGYKKGVQKQPSFSKALRQQNLEDNEDGNRGLFQSFRNQEIQVLEKLMNEHGWTRELVGNNEIKDVREYKQIMREVDTLQVQKQELIDQVENLEEKVQELNEEKREIQITKDTQTLLSQQIQSIEKLDYFRKYRLNWQSKSKEQILEMAKDYLPNRFGTDKYEKAYKIIQLEQDSMYHKALKTEVDDFLTLREDCIQKNVSERVKEEMKPYQEKISQLDQESQKKDEQIYQQKKTIEEYKEKLAIEKRKTNELEEIVEEQREKIDKHKKIQSILWQGLRELGGYVKEKYHEVLHRIGEKFGRNHIYNLVDADNEQLEELQVGCEQYKRKEAEKAKRRPRGFDGFEL